MEVVFKFKSVEAFSSTWAVARKQSELESALGRSHLEDTDQSQSQLQGIKGDEEGRFQGKLKDESIS